MKYIYIKLCLLAILTVANSCSSDFLDKQPHDALSESSFWQSIADADAGITAVYDALNVPANKMGWCFMGTFDLLTPIGYARNGGMQRLSAGDMDPSGGTFRFLWESSYRGIVRANDFLMHVDKIVTSDIEEERLEILKGEALYLRSMFYFHLADMYGDVPIFTDVPNVEDAFVEKSTKQEVLTLIKNDLDAAIDILPVNAISAGHVTKGAALSMRAKVAMLEEDWVAAKSAIDQVITLGYDLVPNYSDIFSIENENNEEVIFDIQYIFMNDAEPGGTYERLYANRSSEAEGFSVLQPTLWFVDKFEKIEDNPEYTIEDPRIKSAIYDYFEGRDPRMDATIIRPGAHFLGLDNKSILHPYEMNSINHSRTGMQMRKYVIEGDMDRTLPGETPLNFIVLRYADILLMKTEVEANLAGGAASVSQEVLDATINRVRSRASEKLSLYVSGNISMDDIYDEYIRELGFEGWMYYNFKRWGWIEINNGHNVMGLTINNREVSFNTRPVQTRVFVAPKDYYWPIPASELERAENLTQNPLWD